MYVCQQCETTSHKYKDIYMYVYIIIYIYKYVAEDIWMYIFIFMFVCVDLWDECKKLGDDIRECGRYPAEMAPEGRILNEVNMLILLLIDDGMAAIQELENVSMFNMYDLN